MAITDLRALGERPLEAWLDELAAAGVDAVQVREKDLSGRELFDLVARVRRRLPSSVSVLVNGRLDVALAAAAEGVHLPAAGLPAGGLRRWARARGADPLIGRSTHALPEVTAARDDGADYALFGPVFATPSKRRYGPPAGPEALARAAHQGIPVLALGGMDEAGLEVAAAAGAHGAAGIRVFLDSVARAGFVAKARAVFRESASSPVVDSPTEPKP